MRDDRQLGLPQPPAESDLFDLALVGHAILFALRAPLRHPFIAALAFCLIFAAAIGGWLIYPQRYEVSTVILAGSPLSGALGGEQESERNLPTRAARELLLRRDNLEKLVRETNFPQRYLEARPPALRMVHSIIDSLNGTERTASNIVDSLVDTLEDRLWITVYPEGTVSITLQWWDTQIAYDLVDAAARSFLEMRRSAEIATVAKSIDILEQHRQSLEAEIERRIGEIEEREAAEKKDRPAASRPIIRVAPRTDAEVSRLQSALEASRRAAIELESARQQRLMQLQAELVQQQTIYAPDHPAIASTERMIARLQQPSPQLNELYAEIRRLEGELASRGAHAASGALAAGSHYLDASPLLIDEDPRAEHERALLHHLRTQLNETISRIAFARLQMETAEAAFEHRYAIVVPPRIPKGPAKPYTAMFLTSGFVGGAIFALLASVALDVARGKVLEAWQLEHQLQLPILARIRR